MDQARLQEIDRELEALGVPPADLSGLIARYAGETAVSAVRADELLADLGAEPAYVPPRLQATVVDVAAPGAWDLGSPALDEVPDAASQDEVSAQASEPSTEAATVSAQEQQAEASARASVFPPAGSVVEPPASAESVESDAADVEPGGEDDASTGDWSVSADSLADEPFVTEAPRGRAAFPWESEPPPAMQAEDSGDVERSAAPRRRDTAELELPQDVAARLAAAPAIDLGDETSSASAVDENAAPAQSHEEGLAVDAALSQVLGSDANDAPSADSSEAASESAEDEFEIMVDDDVLEIDEGDVEMVDDED